MPNELRPTVSTDSFRSAKIKEEISSRAIGGSIPSGPATPHQTRGFDVSSALELTQKASAHPLREVGEAFLLTKRVAGCTQATSWLRGGTGLDEVRRLLGHESLSTTLRYSSLVGADLQRAHRKAGAIERLRL